MSFFEKYGKPQELKVSKAATPKKQLKTNIAKQRMLINGEVVKGVKGNSIRSWFLGGAFSPKLGINGLFGDKKIPYVEGKELELLNDFEKALDSGEFDVFIADIKKKEQK